MKVDLSIKESDREEQAYSDFFKQYSIVIKKWIDTIKIPGKNVAVHYGSSERIWTKLIRDRQNYSIDLPIVSFTLDSWKADTRHNQPPEVTRNVGGNVINAKPGFYLLNYKITWWVKYLKESDLIKYQVESVFTPELFLMVRNEIWEDINQMPYFIDARINSFSDANEMEPGDKQDRVIKLELDIEVDAKLSYIKQGSLGKPIQLIGVDVYTDDEIDKKNQIIKDNIKDDLYLESILDYTKRLETF